MRLNTLLMATVALALGTTACDSKKKPTGKAVSTPKPTVTTGAKPGAAKVAPAAKAEAKPRPAKEGWKPPTNDSSEVVFDPANPPSGYVNCHRNHCHKVGGGVASYRQVMTEMGATKVKGQVRPDQMPPAPKDVAAAPASATKTASGLASLLLTKGTGTRKPGPTNRVSVHYTGWTTDGKAFDSSMARGKPAQFPLNRVIKGWTEGLQLMVEGEERRFWIPSELAYAGRPGKPAGMLVFDVELLKIID